MELAWAGPRYPQMAISAAQDEAAAEAVRSLPNEIGSAPCRLPLHPLRGQPLGRQKTPHGKPDRPWLSQTGVHCNTG